MRFKSLIAALVMAAVATPALAAAPPAGQTNFLGTQLSSCMRNALIGAGVGAVAGLITSDKHKVKNAAIGGAVGGVGTYFVCKYLGNRDQTRIERSYLTALKTDKPVTANFTTQNGGGPAALSVPAPVVDANDPKCKIISPTLATGGLSAQALPQERYCKNAEGVWVPTGQ